LSTRPERTGGGPGCRVPDGPAGPTLVAGVAGALTDDLRPGDLLVADRVEGPHFATECPPAPLVVGALRRAGLPARLGTVVSTERVVDGARRTALAAKRSVDPPVRVAVAVDTESAFLAPAVPLGQLVVVRAVVDTPDRRLWSLGTVGRGLHALRALRDAAAVIDDWAAAVTQREVRIGVPGSVLPVIPGCDLVLVAAPSGSPVGPRLVEAARRTGVESHLVHDVGEVDLRWLAGRTRVAISLADSGSRALADELVGCLRGLGGIRMTALDDPEPDSPGQNNRPSNNSTANLAFPLPREVV
jgi:4-hydroxy-3-methylbut-2-en-1-yl diphosphate reductase